MRGRGETVEPIDALAPLDLVIVAPDFGCSTPAVYRAWDDLAGPVSSRAIDAPSGYPGPFGNDLEPAAEHVEPRLRAFREHVEEVLQRPALLCGSGSAVAAWFVRRGRRRVRGRVREPRGHRVRLDANLAVTEYEPA